MDTADSSNANSDGNASNNASGSGRGSGRKSKAKGGLDYVGNEHQALLTEALGGSRGVVCIDPGHKHKLVMLSNNGKVVRYSPLEHDKITKSRHYASICKYKTSKCPESCRWQDSSSSAATTSGHLDVSYSRMLT
ncbi:hypothetical protein H4R19_003623 [Coemansia spiralis]|nr:hypothetical protein H4R19_003623 [Coemansia spiralis]